MSVVLVKPVKSDSFLVSGNRASSRLKTRLESRFDKAGDPSALFITLTYNREDWDSPLHLYRDQREERHVRRFMKRVSEYLQVDTNAKWIRKIEFQQGGWIHFHIILDTPKTIPQIDLMQLWGFGYVWINRCTKKRINYLCKYIAKDNHNIPAYILAEEQRSVKIIAVSPGYWLNDRKSITTKQSKRNIKWAVYSPVVNSLSSKCIIKTKESQRTIHGNIWDVMSMLESNGGLFIGSNNEYLHIVLHDSNLLDAIHPDTCRRAGFASRRPLLDNGVKCATETSEANGVFDQNNSFFIKYFFEEEGYHG